MVVSMERWVGKVAIVTGASAGIGASIVRQLVQHGMIVAGLARRKDRVEQLAKELQGAKGKLHAVVCDITKEDDILKAFKWVSANLGPVHVLINNAGIVRIEKLSEGSTETWRQIFDTNVLGLSIATREAVQIMKSNKIDGHIVHINSVAGHRVPSVSIPLSLYPASKHAVTALAEILKQEFVQDKLKIKITSISPGGVATEILNASNIDLQNIEEGQTLLQPEDVADSVVYALSTPPNVQITELTVQAVGETI